MKHPATEHANTEHAAGEHAAGEHAAGEYAAGEHPVTEHAATEQATAIHPAVLHPAAAHEAIEHPVVEHPAAEHPAAEGPPTEHSVTERPDAAHPATERPDAAHPAAERPAAERPGAEHGFASHAAMAAEPPIHSEPAPKSNLSYRPDTYLPPSVRIIADDPYAAIAPEPAIAPPVVVEPVKAWPVMAPAVREAPELPTISYPEITPAEEPVAKRGSSSRGRRPLQVAVAVLVLAAGGYLAMSFYSPVRGSHVRGDASAPAAAVADRPALPEDTPPPAPSAVTTRPSPDLPVVVTPTAPASSGFAAALEPRAIASGPPPNLPAQPGAAQQPPATSTADSTTPSAPIAPPPAQMQIDVPALPGTESLVAAPRSKSDSAMKRILRAVTGGKNPK